MIVDGFITMRARDMILIVLVQLVINVICFALGHQRGYQKAHDDLWEEESLKSKRERNQ